MIVACRIRIALMYADWKYCYVCRNSSNPLLLSQRQTSRAKEAASAPLCYRSANPLELSRQYWVQPGNHVRYVKSYTRSNLFTKLYDSLRTFKLIQKFCIKICTGWVLNSFPMSTNQREFSTVHQLICVRRRIAF